MIFGDFNEILNIDEHSGNKSSLPRGMSDFQDIVRHCSLTDMKSHGPLYTWCNKREEDLICKKIDRVLMSASWIASYPQSYCVFEPGGCSDHVRCRIQITTAKQNIRRPFKFTNAISSLLEFLPLLKEYWEDTDVLFNSTSALFRFSKKLKGLKFKLRQLSKKHMGDLTR